MYFTQWKESIEQRPGYFNTNDKDNMFISWQTHEGFQITVHSFKEVEIFLLEHGVSYVLPKDFAKMTLKIILSGNRRRRDNPSLKDVRL